MSYSATVLADSPVSYWPFNETSGITATDSADANNGTYNNSPTLNVTGFGNATPAVTFNGSNQSVSIADATNLHLSAPISIEALVKTTFNSGSTAIIFAKYSTSAPFAGYALAMASGKLQMWVGDTSWFTGTALINDGNWHHVVGTLSGTTVLLYIDGKLDSSGTRTPSLSNTSIATIANSAINVGFPGTISNVAVYNTALTLTKIINHYLSIGGSGNIRVSQEGLLAVTQGTPAVRVSQEGLLAVTQGTPKVRISQEGLLAIVTLRSGKIIKVPLNGLNIGSDFSGGMS